MLGFHLPDLEHVLVPNLRDFLLRILPAINRLLGLVLDGLDHLVMGVP